jgi:ABC-type multidrug transport system fused ATPase/permease subunit
VQISRVTSSPIFRAAQLFQRAEKRKLLAVLFIQIFMSFLDLVAIAIVGVLGSLAVTGVSSRDPESRVGQFIQTLGLSGFSFQSQVAILGVSAAMMLTVRTVLSIVFSRRTLIFLSRRAASLSETLFEKLFSQSLLFIKERSSQQNLFAITQGVSSITVGIIGTSIALIADLSLTVILLVGLFLVDPAISISMVVVFTLIGFSLYKLMQGKAHYLAHKGAELEISSNEQILEVLNSYREIVVKNRREYFFAEIALKRYELSDVQGRLAFLPNISKYVIESTVVLGSLAIGAYQFLTTEATQAIATLSVFLAAGMRIGPATLRMQQGAMQLKINMGSASQTLDLIEALLVTPTNFQFKVSNADKSEFIPSVEISKLNFNYPGSATNALMEINLSVKPGESVAIVGKSGAGKTTLVDLMLGMFEPSSGEILISGLHPLGAIRKWGGVIAYVPQNVSIMSGTIRSNLAQGFDENEFTDAQYWGTLEIARLADFVHQLPKGLDSAVGEFGSLLSGGQRQRLGIARAFMTNPRLIILDEATSSLDGQTEAEFSNALAELKNRVTTIVIAHRLSTIKEVDRIILLQEGRVIAEGNYAELLASSEEFSKQLGYLGRL